MSCSLFINLLNLIITVLYTKYARNINTVCQNKLKEIPGNLQTNAYSKFGC